MRINFYKSDGKLSKTEKLTNENIARTAGMMVKCHLKNGTKAVGYADPYRSHDSESERIVRDYIYLWTWKNIDEKTHRLIGDGSERYDQVFKKVILDDIIQIDAILHSNPRWGGKITNRFMDEEV